MAFSTQALKYGWVALASLGVLTGTTIYVVNNLRHQVNAETIIEIVLGVTERCFATQTGTNASGDPVYSVTPPSFVRTWYSNVYTTNGVTIYTNIVTNTIGWHLDRDMMISLDTTISNLIPYYVNTNALDTNAFNLGVTNIPYLTVTGLWASLGIGDGTNKFTREPGWTNIVTNWFINYTSYWPSTSGVTTNISYTSDWQQVVNYASSWTATGGHLWVTSSIWPSATVAVTNDPTYGGYPWQIYEEDLVERYKVLNALEWVKDYAPIVTNALSEDKYAYSDFKTNWALAKAQAASLFTAASITVTNFPSNKLVQRDCFRKYRTLNTSPVFSNAYRAGIAVQRIQLSLYIPSGSVTQFPTEQVVGAVFLSPGDMISSTHNEPFADFYPGYNWLFDSGADGFIESNYVGYSFSTLGSNSTGWIGTLDDTVSWPVEPIPIYEENARGYFSSLWDFDSETEPLQYLFVKYQFNYCTNRFW